MCDGCTLILESYFSEEIWEEPVMKIQNIPVNVESLI